MRIVADENIPYAMEYLGRLGEVRLVAGRALTSQAVREAEMLFVRSVTRVGRELLEGSRVRFVGSATAGTEHVDQAWLAAQGIAFADAAGSNAESVAQYLAAALAWVASQGGRPLVKSSIGIVGVGHCGSRVERIARALGMDVVLCDPPLARATGQRRYRPLDELLHCDYLTLHVPLAAGGPDPTLRLIDAARIAEMKAGAVLIHTCRGGVVDEQALRSALDAGHLEGAVLDVWENEPAIDLELLGRVMLGTPHIAGYSLDGKVAGTRMVYEAACLWLERSAEALKIDLLPPALPQMDLDGAGRSFESVASEAIRTAYPIERDSAALREAVKRDPRQAAAAFDARRKHYGVRREFQATRLCVRNAPASYRERLIAIGFEYL